MISEPEIDIMLIAAAAVAALTTGIIQLRSWRQKRGAKGTRRQPRNSR